MELSEKKIRKYLKSVASDPDVMEALRWLSRMIDSSEGHRLLSMDLDSTEAVRVQGHSEGRNQLLNELEQHAEEAE